MTVGGGVCVCGQMFRGGSRATECCWITMGVQYGFAAGASPPRANTRANTVVMRFSPKSNNGPSTSQYRVRPCAPKCLRWDSVDAQCAEDVLSITCLAPRQQRENRKPEHNRHPWHAECANEG